MAVRVWRGAVCGILCGAMSMAFGGCVGNSSPPEAQPTVTVTVTTRATEPPAAPTPADTPVEWNGDSTNAIDSEGWAKVVSLIDAGKPIRSAYAALVRGGSLDLSAQSDEALVLRIDKVELVDSPGTQGPFFRNRKKQVVSVEMADVLVLVDPHNHFQSVDVREFLKHVDHFKSNPFYFYSQDGQIVAIVQMMLP